MMTCCLRFAFVIIVCHVHCQWRAPSVVLPLLAHRHAETVQQVGSGKQIPPSGWRCERCDLTSNLWLNLSDGVILCGRRFFYGSGGNDHAVDHYRQTNYPLAVKLGTITQAGAGCCTASRSTICQQLCWWQCVPYCQFNVKIDSSPRFLLTAVGISVCFFTWKKKP